MRILTSATILLLSVLISGKMFAFSSGDFVLIHGLVKATELNDRSAIIIGSQETDDNGEARFPVLVWLDENQASFKQVRVKAANLLELNVDPLFVVSLSDTRAKEYSIIITSLGQPGTLIKDAEIKNKCRLIGAAIASVFGFEGMRSVAECDKSYLRFIETCWDGIGQWQG